MDTTENDSDRMILFIEQGKGRKDRQAMLSECLLELLGEWWCAASPMLSHGDCDGVRYHAISLLPRSGD